MGFGWQEIDKTLDLGYIRVAGLHRECKPAVLFEPSNFRPRTMTHNTIHREPYKFLHSKDQECYEWSYLHTYALKVVKTELCLE